MTKNTPKTTKIILCAPRSSPSKLGHHIPRMFVSGHIPLPCTPSRTCRSSSIETDARCWCGSRSLHLQENCSTKVWQPDHGIASCSIQSWSTALQVWRRLSRFSWKIHLLSVPFLVVSRRFTQQTLEVTEVWDKWVLLQLLLLLLLEKSFIAAVFYCIIHRGE